MSALGTTHPVRQQGEALIERLASAVLFPYCRCRSSSKRHYGGLDANASGQSHSALAPLSNARAIATPMRSAAASTSRSPTWA